MRRPQLDLVVDAEGRRKWLRADRDDGTPRRVRVAQVRADETPGRFSMPALREDSGPPIIRDGAGPTPEVTREEPASPRAPAGAREPRALQVPSIRIADGIVRYRDLRTGSADPIRSDPAPHFPEIRQGTGAAGTWQLCLWRRDSEARGRHRCAGGSTRARPRADRDASRRPSRTGALRRLHLTR